ncbi:lysozyme inhibitor LprI family protein, partial [Caulobacter sp. 17J65-9]|uniref:lysozyme inhibitor LprI family protein n=1 Tax=Caulobacter sp. 17J65-9 TaxID=2709382 RepID=UPI0013C59AD0
ASAAKPATPAATPEPAAPEPAAAAVTNNALLPRGVMHAWPKDAPGPVHVAIDGLLLTLASTGGGEDAPAVPHLTVRAPNGASGELVGEGGSSSVAATFGAGHFEERRPAQDVILTTYTGGAHCCVEIKVLSLSGGKWRAVDVGTFDGEPLDTFPRDIDGDGVSEIEVYDNRFLYAFTAYAFSMAPPQFWVVRDGEAVDVSAEPRFRKEFEAYLPDAKAGCQEHNNGACAAYLAAAARAGRFAEAWKTVSASYDSKDDWGLPSVCLDAQKPGRACPKNREFTFTDFPSALKWFVIDTGYLTADAMKWPEGQGPSFDCAKVHDVNLTLVCVTPELAAADRALSAAYAAASGSGSAGLRRSQRAWLAARDKAAPDAGVLQRLYEQRIAELNALAR